MSSHAQPFTLQPHPAMQTQAVSAIHGSVRRTPDGLQVSYVLEGDLDQLRIPPPRARGFADELWRHTCFEVFIARKGGPPYYEFNFSPSREWAAYAFVRYRERVPLGVAPADVDPQTTVHRAGATLELQAEIPLGHLAPQYADASLVLGLSTVVETADGTLSYWALKHPGDKPDFHHPDAFVLELDEIRN